MKTKLVQLGTAAAVVLAGLVPSTAAYAHGRGHGYGHRNHDGRYYERSYADNGYYGNRNYGDRGYYNEYRSDRRYRCGRGSGTTGMIVGGIAGGLLGRAVVGRYGDRTAGTIIGAGAGALAGRAVDRSDDRYRC